MTLRGGGGATGPVQQYGSAYGTTAGTVTIPAGAILNAVNVVADVASCTLTIGSNPTMTLDAGEVFDAIIPGTVAGNIVITGSVHQYYVDWAL